MSLKKYIFVRYANDKTANNFSIFRRFIHVTFRIGLLQKMIFFFKQY